MQRLVNTVVASETNVKLLQLAERLAAHETPEVRRLSTRHQDSMTS